MGPGSASVGHALCAAVAEDAALPNAPLFPLPRAMSRPSTPCKQAERGGVEEEEEEEEERRPEPMLAS